MAPYPFSLPLTPTLINPGLHLNLFKWRDVPVRLFLSLQAPSPCFLHQLADRLNPPGAKAGEGSSRRGQPRAQQRKPKSSTPAPVFSRIVGAEAYQQPSQMQDFFPLSLILTRGLGDQIGVSQKDKVCVWGGSLFPSLLNLLKPPYFSDDSELAKEIKPGGSYSGIFPGRCFNQATQRRAVGV